MPKTEDSPGAALGKAADETVWYELSCPHCEQDVEAQADLIGEVFECPHCRGEIELEVE